MQQLEQILTFILDHKELIATLFMTLITVIGTLGAGSEALDVVIGAIERLGQRCQVSGEPKPNRARPLRHQRPKPTERPANGNRYPDRARVFGGFLPLNNPGQIVIETQTATRGTQKAVRGVLAQQRSGASGRCRLEIPAVLGTGRILVEWAWPCFAYGGNEDIGVFLLPRKVRGHLKGQSAVLSGCGCQDHPGEQPEKPVLRPDLHRSGDKPNTSDRRASEHKKHHGHRHYCAPQRLIETGHTRSSDDRDESSSRS